jgi:AraC-like DNA-binding protein
MRDELVLLASSRVKDAHVLVNKHLHGYATIQFATDIVGTAVISYDDDIYELTSGDWFFPAHPGPLIRFNTKHAGESWFHRHIAFSGPLVEKWRSMGIWLEKPQQAPEGIDWKARMDFVIDLARANDALSRWRTINGIEAILLDLTLAREQINENSWLAGVLELLEKPQVDFNKIASELGLSETALRRKFKAATGQTMQDWVLNRKINAAKTLLCDSDLPLKAIAGKLGYANEHFFSRQFKSFVGIAPGAFRKSRLAG